uniref:Uncharacterized protein n=1 Tax=Pseudictyota dubia TaxID=2749911 RepID=A0A7R9VMT0_9STRA|mmetsp:Transcript_18126/g.33773  ORF Transcript_18126/g.33773 Transcript_18126/m.33773 type:complete len:389 (+) Transcript_18126:147-1313(+)
MLGVNENTTTPKSLKRYERNLKELMSYTNSLQYPRGAYQFSTDELSRLTPDNIRAFLAYKAYGVPNPTPDDKPTKGGLYDLQNYKKAISHFMPKKMPWNDVTQEGNPTVSAVVSELIEDVREKKKKMLEREKREKMLEIERKEKLFAKMGARPPDFDEALVRQAPTFIKWQALRDGEKLRYACRDFVKGYGEDEERLMRRIMIARRNNLRDHEKLKRARALSRGRDKEEPSSTAATKTMPTKEEKIKATVAVAETDSSKPSMMTEGVAVEAGTAAFALPKRRRIISEAVAGGGGSSSCGSATAVDIEAQREMDVPAVEATRSYKAWLALEHGKELIYNCRRYVKGEEGEDWFLKKTIWRRMRYRRENKKMVERLKHEVTSGSTESSSR